HRVVDGADAARFLVTLKERLEGGAFEAVLGLSFEHPTAHRHYWRFRSHWFSSCWPP
ncbi:MAG: hypothetical protein RL524_643, partial [Actinomycetota bacterium]